MSDLSLRRDLEFRSRPRSFVLRVWREELGAGCREWRGQLRDAATGEVRYFRGWPGLMACLEEMLGGEIDGVNSRR